MILLFSMPTNSQPAQLRLEQLPPVLVREMQWDRVMSSAMAAITTKIMVTKKWRTEILPPTSTATNINLILRRVKLSVKPQEQLQHRVSVSIKWHYNYFGTHRIIINNPLLLWLCYASFFVKLFETPIQSYNHTIFYNFNFCFFANSRQGEGNTRL